MLRRALFARLCAGVLALAGAWMVYIQNAYTQNQPARRDSLVRRPKTICTSLRWRRAKTLAADFGWTPGGLALQQVDALIAESK
jgi:hypothetical protein